MKALTIFLMGLAIAATARGQNKAPVRVYLESFRSAKTYQLSARVLAKKGRRYRPAAETKVLFYVSEASPDNLLGAIITSDKGTGTYTFTPEQVARVQNLTEVDYIAVVNETDSLQGKKTAITIKDVTLDVRFAIGEDSAKQIFARVWETDSAGNTLPQKKVKIQFLAERPLSPLPIGDAYMATDAEGKAAAIFPDDLPGDTDGKVKILVRITDNDDYGTVEVSAVKPWGIPTLIDDATTKRSLWASGANAPIPLLIFINSLIISVWGIIFYILYEIFHIRKIGEGKSLPRSLKANL